MSSVEQPNRIFESFEAGNYLLESSETHSLPINIIASNPLEFKIIHNVNRPDHTPRFWISKTPRSLSVSWGGRPAHLNIKNSFYNIRIVASTDKRLYSQLYTFLVEEGLWYINVQNLENFKNGYQISLPNN